MAAAEFDGLSGSGWEAVRKDRSVDRAFKWQPSIARERGDGGGAAMPWARVVERWQSRAVAEAAAAPTSAKLSG